MKPKRKGTMAEPTYTLDEARTEIARQECRESGHTFDAIAPTTTGEPATPQSGQLWLYAYPNGGTDVVWIYEAASSTGHPQAIDAHGAYGPLETLTHGARPVKKLADARDHQSANGTEGTAR